ncbi:unnamed protein product [Phaeothamnion confervicola]
MASAQAKPPADDVLIGTWDIVEGAAAPWAPASERADLAAIAKRLVKTQVVFAAHAVTTTAKPFACKKAFYEATEYSPDAMFRGGLPELNQDRIVRDMGFARGDVPGIDVMCGSETLSYHFRDRVTIMVAIDNILYTLKRGK